MLPTSCGVSFVLDSCRVVHHVFFALAKLELLKFLSGCPACDGQFSHAFVNISMRKHSPVFMIAQMIRASLLASATVTGRAGLRASSAASQSRRALSVCRRHAVAMSHQAQAAA
jgi:hypothetical protein